MAPPKKRNTLTTSKAKDTKATQRTGAATTPRNAAAQKEEASILNRERQIIQSNITRITSSFSFIADYRLSPNHNAFLHLSSMTAWFYFDRPNNLAFRDLTTTIAPLRNLRSLLVLGHKFCPTPRFSISCVNVSFSRFNHDLYCKSFFAGLEFDAESTYDPKMYINSVWTQIGRSLSLLSVATTISDPTPLVSSKKDKCLRTSYATNT